MKYHYVASQANGQVVNGDLEAASPSEILAILSSQGLRPISIKPQKSFLGRKVLFGGKVKTADKVFLTKYIR